MTGRRRSCSNTVLAVVGLGTCFLKVRGLVVNAAWVDVSKIKEKENGASFEHLVNIANSDQSSATARLLFLVFIVLNPYSNCSPWKGSASTLSRLHLIPWFRLSFWAKLSFFLAAYQTDILLLKFGIAFSFVFDVMLTFCIMLLPIVYCAIFLCCGCNIFAELPPFSTCVKKNFNNCCQCPLRFMVLSVTSSLVPHLIFLRLKLRIPVTNEISNQTSNFLCSKFCSFTHPLEGMQLIPGYAALTVKQVMQLSTEFFKPFNVK